MALKMVENHENYTGIFNSYRKWRTFDFWLSRYNFTKMYRSSKLLSKCMALLPTPVVLNLFCFTAPFLCYGTIWRNPWPHFTCCASSSEMAAPLVIFRAPRLITTKYSVAQPGWVSCIFYLAWVLSFTSEIYFFPKNIGFAIKDVKIKRNKLTKNIQIWQKISLV